MAGGVIPDSMRFLGKLLHFATLVCIAPESWDAWFLCKQRDSAEWTSALLPRLCQEKIRREIHWQRRQQHQGLGSRFARFCCNYTLLDGLLSGTLTLFHFLVFTHSNIRKMFKIDFFSPVIRLFLLCVNLLIISRGFSTLPSSVHPILCSFIHLSIDSFYPSKNSSVISASFFSPLVFFTEIYISSLTDF